MLVQCKQCNKEFNKSLYEIQKTNNNFCSMSCAATYNNKISPKRKLSKICKKENCKNLIKSYRHTLCEKHWLKYMEWRGDFCKNKTIGEYREKLSVKKKHPSWLHSHIRRFARSWLKDLIKKPCSNCGYSKHVELCHIKSISSFPISAKLEEVNHKDNIIQLCRNCHWEFDNKLLKIEK